jgi:radical SAM protein with 4Fe4S-binding SPASM domain
MGDYGEQLIKKGIFDVLYKPKNWFISRVQYKILNFFGKLPDYTFFDRWFARIARKLIGGYLYSIKLEVNNFCTLNCKICYVPKGEMELPYEVITRLLNQIKSYKIRLEILGGEPLLRKDILEIVEYAKQEARIPFVSLYTNGLPATPQISNGLKDAGLDAAIVNLFSHKKEVHDELTGHLGSWDKTLEGIQNLKQAGINVYTFTVIHRLNYQDYKKIYHFVKNELNVHALFYQYIPQEKDDPFMINPHTWNIIKHWLIYEKNKEHGEFVRKFFMLTGNICSGGNFVFTVKIDGSVQPCPFISDIPLGNIYKQDIWTILKNRFRQSLLTKFKCVPEECTNCSYKSVCGGGCKAGNNVLFGHYDRKDPRCLGPYSKPLKKDDIIDCVPTFF